MVLCKRRHNIARNHTRFRFLWWPPEQMKSTRTPEQMKSTGDEILFTAGNLHNSIFICKQDWLAFLFDCLNRFGHYRKFGEMRPKPKVTRRSLECWGYGCNFLAQICSTWDAIHCVFTNKIDPKYDVLCWEGIEKERQYSTPSWPLPFQVEEISRKGLLPPSKNCQHIFHHITTPPGLSGVLWKLFSGQGVSLFFYRDMYWRLVGWVSVQEPSFSFRKSICSTDLCVVQMFNQLSGVLWKLFSGQGVSLFFYRDMYWGLVGWVSVQEPSFSFRKSICSTDLCVVQMFNQLFFGGKKDGENKYCVGLYLCPRAGDGVCV